MAHSGLQVLNWLRLRLFTSASQKAGRLAGAGTSELQAGLLQVKQAFASGRLAGDEAAQCFGELASAWR